jgi:thiosulfate/3-mercaptopyruvate sulfurtransferase
MNDASPLVAPAELAGELPAPLVLDVRWTLAGSDPAGYRERHVPGAVFLDLDAVLADPPGRGGRHPLPSPERLQSGLRAAGVTQDRPVVVYDEAATGGAARAWWVLRWAGVDAVRVLDGGLAAWEEAGLPTESGDVTAPAGDVVVRPGQLPVLDAKGAAGLAERGVLVDARAPERFRGEIEPVDPVGGHVPGAQNAPNADFVTVHGRLRPAEEIRRRATELGIAPGTEVGVYCGSGITAAVDVLALATIGVPAALYPGSWSEWITDSNRPVATGP